jgi:hypothetical protein
MLLGSAAAAVAETVAVVEMVAVAFGRRGQVVGLGTVPWDACRTPLDLAVAGIASVAVWRKGLSGPDTAPSEACRMPPGATETWDQCRARVAAARSASPSIPFSSSSSSDRSVEVP